MQDLTLTLDGQPVDLSPDAVLALSYRSSDLRRLDTREAAFSETMTLPLTAANVNALGHPHALSSQTRTPYRRLPAVLRADGAAVLRGAAVLEASERGYEVTLLDDTADLFGRVGEARLRDLDLRAYDHTRTYAAIAAAVTNEPGRGYVYALADAGHLGARPAAEPIIYDELPASVYAATVLRAVVARALPGFRLTGALLAHPLFQRLVLPCATAGPRLRPAYVQPYEVQATVDAAITYPLPYVGANELRTARLAFPVLQIGAPDRFSGTAYVAPPHYAQLTVRVRLLLDPGQYDFALSLEDSNGNGLAFINYPGPLPVGGGVVPPNPNTAVFWEVVLPAVLAGAPIVLRVRKAAGYIGDRTLPLTVKAGSSITFSVAPYALDGAPVHLEASLPDWSEAELLTLLANQFNATFVVDAVRRTLRCDLFNELERRRPEAPDWTAKLDYAARPRLEYRLPNYAQQNVFRYHEAPDAYAPAFGVLTPAQAAEQLGQAALAVPDETLPATAAAYESVAVLPVERLAAGRFTATWLPLFPDPDPADPRTPVPYTPGGSYRGQDKVWWLGRAWSSTQSAYGVAGEPGPLGGDWTADTIPDAQVSAVALLAPGPLLALRAARPDPATFFVALVLTRTGLSFAELLPAFHEGTARILGRVQLLTVRLALTPADITGLDFARPVRLNVRHWPGYGELQGLFYLNLIDQYRPGQAGSTRVELLRLGAPVAGLAPAALPLPARPDRRLLHEDGVSIAVEPGQYLVLES